MRSAVLRFSRRPRTTTMIVTSAKMAGTDTYHNAASYNIEPRYHAPPTSPLVWTN